MNQAITKMAPVQRKGGAEKKKEASLHSLCCFTALGDGWQMGLGRSSLTKMRPDIRFCAFGAGR